MTGAEAARKAVPYLFIPMAVGGIGVFSGGREPAVALWAFLASLAMVVAVAAAEFRAFSFVVLVALMQALCYPIAASLNLTLVESAIEPDLWVTADLAMIAGTVGSIFLAAGAFLARFIGPPPWTAPPGLTSRPFNLACFGLQLFVVAVMLALGVYYHPSIGGGADQSVRIYLNTLNILSWIGYLGIFFELIRYQETKRGTDAAIVVAMVVATIALYMPSGRRTNAIEFLPLLLLFYAALERSVRARVVVMTIGGVAVLLLVSVMGIYRGLVETGLESEEREAASTMAEASRVGFEEWETAASVIVFRFSDFVATGRIVDSSPEIVPHRGFEGVEEWWQMFLPGFLRQDFDLGNDGVREVYKYGIIPDLEGYSRPVMILGDLYGRWGWAGIGLGMTALGFFLGLLDRWILWQVTPFSVAFFVLYGRLVYAAPWSSTLNVFLMSTRELVLMFALAFLLARVGGVRMVTRFAEAR